MRDKVGRADVGIGPYESVTRSADGRADVGIGPYGGFGAGAWVLRIATASVRTGFAMTWFLQGGAVGRADVGIGPYGSVSCGA